MKLALAHLRAFFNFARVPDITSDRIARGGAEGANHRAAARFSATIENQRGVRWQSVEGSQGGWNFAADSLQADEASIDEDAVYGFFLYFQWLGAASDRAGHEGLAHEIFDWKESPEGPWIDRAAEFFELLRRIEKLSTRPRIKAAV